MLRSLQRVFLNPASPARRLLWAGIALLVLAAVTASSLPFQPPAPTPQATAPAHALTQAARLATASATIAEQNNETNGIILGGVVLVLIILGGTLQALRPHPSDKS